MQIEGIKKAVDAARDRQGEGIQDCPFCGTAPNTRRLDHDFGGRTEVYDCTNDNCSIQPETTASEKSYQSWNRRPAQEQADTALIALWEMVQPVEPPDEPLYYLQDARDYIGNAMIWWAKGGGYTAHLDKAQAFTKDAAERRHRSRKSDRPWLKSYIDKISSPHVDMQYTDYEAMQQMVQEQEATNATEI